MSRGTCVAVGMVAEVNIDSISEVFYNKNKK
jgi:hypothetical protein